MDETLYTPLGLNDDGTERKISRDCGVYLPSMGKIFAAALDTYHISKPSALGPKKWFHLAKKQFFPSDSEAFYNADPKMDKWISTHRMVTAFFERPTKKGDAEGIEKVVVAYTGLERKFVIFQSHTVESDIFSICEVSLAEEFCVTVNNGTFFVKQINSKRKLRN